MIHQVSHKGGLSSRQLGLTMALRATVRSSVFSMIHEIPVDVSTSESPMPAYKVHTAHRLTTRAGIAESETKKLKTEDGV